MNEFAEEFSVQNYAIIYSQAIIIKLNYINIGLILNIEAQSDELKWTQNNASLKIINEILVE